MGRASERKGTMDDMALDGAGVSREMGMWRPLFLVSGVGFVGLGTIGLFVPVWPSTVFFILALWAFKRSSRRLEDWLLNHRVVGPTLRDWESGGAIRTRTKRVAVGTLWLALGISAILVRAPWVWLILGACGVGVSVYILTRPVAPEPA